MKFTSKTIWFAFLLGAFCFTNQSCVQDECDGKRTYIQHIPIYVQVDEIRQDIQLESARDLCRPGKLFYYQDFIFVNEFREGVHIIDNRNSDNPVNVAFINIPGNVDVAVKGNVMYADNYIDLLAFDITDPTNPIFKARTTDVFNSIGLNEELGHLVYYEQTEVTEELDCSDPNFGAAWWPAQGNVFVAAETVRDFDSNVDDINTNLPNGIAGSLAAFSVIGDFLYVIDEWRLDAFDLEDPCNPVFHTTTEVGWAIETLFPYKDDLLFIGSQSGMFIYSVATPGNPVYLSEFQHARACDPVIVKDDIAYVTLRDGTTCLGFNNQLDVIDVSDVNNPVLMASFNMENPHGLSIKGNTLYLCEGRFGLKAFDLENLEEIDEQLLAQRSDVHAFDVIALPHKDVALVIGDDGFYQYDISNPEELNKMSEIKADPSSCE